MAHLEIKVREGGLTKIKLGFNVPNKIVDDWESDKEEDAILELSYQITKFLENKRERMKKNANSSSK